MLRRLKLRGAFPKSAGEYTQPLEQLLQRRREQMDEEWGKLEEGWAANNERMVTFGLSPRPDEESVIELNVGGTNVTISWHLLAEMEGFEGSILGDLLEGVWGKEQIPRDADGFIVLDEFPTCIKHIINAVLIGRAGSVLTFLPGSEAHSAVTVDEAPCLTYTAHVMGLWRAVPTHFGYVKLDGGSTVLEPFEIAPFSTKIWTWIGSSTDQLTLIYRATRDGFGREAFNARCNTSSPRTFSLIRFSSGQGTDDDSVVGGYTCYPWGSPVGSRQHCGNEAFAVMLKDGNANRTDLCRPIKDNEVINVSTSKNQFTVPPSDGPYLFAGTLSVAFDKESGNCTLIKKEDDWCGSRERALSLNGKKVVEIEVYRYPTPALPATTVPSATEPGGDALTWEEARDAHLFGQSVASSLMEEKVVLNRAVKELEVAGARVSAAVGALETVYGPNVAAGEQDAVVELNVRGTRMTTLSSTLQACPRSALATMFDEDRWPATDKDKDEHGRRLMDCSPTCFSKILDVLRMRKRASWSRGVAGGKQESEEHSSVPSWAILIKQDDEEVFNKVVNMFFPGCENFIMDVVRPV